MNVKVTSRRTFERRSSSTFVEVELKNRIILTANNEGEKNDQK